MGHFFEGGLNQGGRRLCNFSQIVVRYDWVFCNISTWQLFRSLRKMLPLLVTPLANVGLLHMAG